MNNQSDNLNRTDESILAYDVSDEVLEASACTEKGKQLKTSTDTNPEGQGCPG